MTSLFGLLFLCMDSLMKYVCTSGLKKEPAARDNVVPAATSLANTSVSSGRFDLSSRTASTSHPDLMQLRPPAIIPQRRGESAVSRLAPKTAGPNSRLGSDSANELKLGSDIGNNQRVVEWQARNQMVKDIESARQVPHRFQDESSSIPYEQRPNYYSSRPQSELIEPGYVMSRPAKTASPLPQSTSMPAIADNSAGNRGFGQQSYAAAMPSTGIPAYSDNQRYKPDQLQPSLYDQQFATSVQPQLNQVANVRPQMSEMVRHPLLGMVSAQDLRHSGPNIRSNLPDFRQQPAVIGEGVQYRPSSGSVSPTVAVPSEQRPNYYPSRPQSELIEPGYVMARPAHTASPLPPSSSMPQVTDSMVNRGHMAAGFGHQSSAAAISSVPAYSDNQRYKPDYQQQPRTYDQQFATSVQPPMTNVRFQMSEMVRHPLPGMAPPQDVRQSGPNVRSNLPGVNQQSAVIGNGTQYRPSGGQYGVQGPATSVIMALTTVQYGAANVAAGMPTVSTADGRIMYTPAERYGLPDTYDGRSAPSQNIQYELADVENRAVPVGIPYSTGSRPYATHEGPYGLPRVERPADIRYGMPNVAGVTPSVRPVVPNADAERKVAQAGVRYGMPVVGGDMPPAPSDVRYTSSSSQDRFAEAVPSISHEAAVDQSAMKFSRQPGYYESPNTAMSYSSQEPRYGIHSVSGSTSVVPANIRYDAGNLSPTGDGWPLPPPPSEHYGVSNVQTEFSVPPSVSVPPASISAAQLQNASDDSRSLPSDARVQNTVTPVPSLPSGMPTNDIRPKKQPPPIAAKPKFPVSAGVAVRTKGVVKDEGKQLRPEKMQQKMLEIQRLESRPYLTAGEQTRLQNLRVEVEFDKRLADVTEKREDDRDVEQHRMLPSAVRFHLSLSSYLSTYTLRVCLS